MNTTPTDSIATPARHCWVPVRALAPRHRPRVLGHLLALDARDRYWRFGQHTSDGQIASYVERLDFDHDEIFGIFDRRLELIAMAHLARLEDGDSGRRAEFGVSVLTHARGRGFGERLFERAVLHARNRKVDTLLVQALSENRAMLHIAQRAGATIERHGPESHAVLRLPAQTPATQLEEALERHAADADFMWKRQAHQLSEWLAHLSAQRDGMRKGDSHVTR